MPFNPIVDPALRFHEQHTSSHTPLPQLDPRGKSDSGESDGRWLAATGLLTLTRTWSKSNAKASPRVSM